MNGGLGESHYNYVTYSPLHGLTHFHEYLFQVSQSKNKWMAGYIKSANWVGRIHKDIQNRIQCYNTTVYGKDVRRATGQILR